MNRINNLPNAIIMKLWRYEYRHREERNIETELNRFGYTLLDKTEIGKHEDLGGYLNCEIEEMQGDRR